ncbi:hypothetical protein GCM10027347_11830 [Larkinella harenae]
MYTFFAISLSEYGYKLIRLFLNKQPFGEIIFAPSPIRGGSASYAPALESINQQDKYLLIHPFCIRHWPHQRLEYEMHEDS